MAYEHEVVYGLYRNFEDAASVIHHLTNSGLDSQHITVIVSDEDGRLKPFTTGEYADDAVDAEEGAGFGAIVGTLTALGIAVLPGVGPVFAAGPLAAALISGIGAVTGAATGAVVAELVELDIDKEDASYYGKVIKEGGALLVVDVYSEWSEDVIENVMEKYHPIRVGDTH